METMTIDKNIILDLNNLVEEMQLKLESLELASDPEIMASLKRSKEQIERGEVIEFDDL